jgi:hypothetical protein
VPTVSASSALVPASEASFRYAGRTQASALLVALLYLNSDRNVSSVELRQFDA